jgi:adenylate cyclase
VAAFVGIRTLVRDQIRAQALSPIRVKGINRAIVPYVVEGWMNDVASKSLIIREQLTGLELFLDVDALDEFAVERAKRRLAEALAALDAKKHGPVA